MVDTKDSTCHILVAALLENFDVALLCHGRSNLLYFQILVGAFLNLLALWNMEELWTSATCSTWQKLKKPSSSV